MSDLVSILIPAYNKERWIAQTVESAIAQTWPSKEIIIIDDGSTDQTLSIARRYEGASVKVVAQENAGACVSRNRLVDLAQGKYIQFLDADDLLHPQKIELQMHRASRLRGQRLLLTCSYGSFHHATGEAVYKPDSLWQNLSPTEWILARIRDNVWMNPTVWLVDHNLCRDAGSWDPRLARSGDDDGEYVLRLAAKADAVEFVAEANCYYRIGNTGSLNWEMGSPESLSALFLAIDLCIGHVLRVENSERTRSACLAYLQRWYDNFYPERTDLVQRANKIAVQLGGQLIEPDLGWKYNWIQATVGWSAAKKVRTLARNGKILAINKLSLWRHDGQSAASVRRA
jgi:glycosyltransferase involved in cell wall biosynthesis